MLELAEKKRSQFRGASLALNIGDTDALPFPDCEFDRILACLTICVTPNPQGAFSELFRLVKPGGRVVLYEMHQSPDPNTAAIQRAMVRIPAMTVGHPPPSPDLPDGVIVWDPCRNLLQLAEAAGFKRLSVEWFEPNHPVMARCQMRLKKPGGITTTEEDTP